MIQPGMLAILMLQMAFPGAPMMQPIPGPSDPRLRTIEYQADQIVRLEVATGYHLSVEFAPDERIETVAVGDSSAWLVTANQRGTHLFIKPVSADADSNMTVITDTRSICSIFTRSIARGPTCPTPCGSPFPQPERLLLPASTKPTALRVSTG